MSLNIYLTFDGNCREVFDFYKSVFGGDYLAFQTYRVFHYSQYITLFSD